MSGLRVIFFGMEGIFSRAPLLELGNARFDIRAVVVPRPAQSLPPTTPIRLLPPPNAIESDVPLLTEPTQLNIIGTAWEASVPVYEVDRLQDSRTIATLRDLRPDVICVACFPFLLPQSLLRSVSHSLNLHPSLLPAYRGPAPLFWIFHDGLENAGVTLHLMDQHADTGDIVAQERILLRDGISFEDAEKVCSEKGARLMVDALRSIELGKFAHSPQSPTLAPHAPNPTDADYVITPEWTARRAFNFIRGMGAGRVRIDIGDQKLFVKEAIAYNADERIKEPMTGLEENYLIQFSPGTLSCSLIPQAPIS